MRTIAKQPTSFRLTSEQIKEFADEILARKREPVPDLMGLLRSVRIEEVYSVANGTWRWAVRLDIGAALNHQGELVWESSLKTRNEVDTARFAEQEKAEDALVVYLNKL